ncbi:cupredoxin domain-containing protein [Candidatus Daviesbacteria bacterium]|nr:cupredoxin domain-containing protein [Candidatus Daviesbacteria bacterium]
MSPDRIIVTILGIAGIFFVFWFFLMKREKEVRVNKSIDIFVKGGYQPEVISIPKGETTQINFIRQDPTDCLEEVVLADFKIRKQLPLNQKISIEITPQNEGEFGYSCGMNMYHGKIIVR